MKMSDRFSICPSCKEMESLRDVTAMYHQVWTKDEIEEFEKYLWCVKCKKLINQKDVHYQHTEYPLKIEGIILDEGKQQTHPQITKEEAKKLDFDGLPVKEE